MRKKEFPRKALSDPVHDNWSKAILSNTTSKSTSVRMDNSSNKKCKTSARKKTFWYKYLSCHWLVPKSPNTRLSQAPPMIIVKTRRVWFAYYVKIQKRNLFSKSVGAICILNEVFFSLICLLFHFSWGKMCLNKNGILICSRGGQKISFMGYEQPRLEIMPPPPP